MSEQLQLAAQVVDKFSAPIRDLQRQLQLLAKETKGAHKEGAGDAQKHSKAWGDLQKTVVTASEKVKSEFVPAIDAMGLSALTAATSLAGIVAAVKGVAGSVQTWTYLSKETGLSVQQLRAYEGMAVRVGSSSEAMDSSLQGFSHTLTDMRHGLGGAYIELNKFASGQKLADQLRASTDAGQALNDVFSTMDSIQGKTAADTIQQRENLLRLLGLIPELARLTGDQRKSLEEWLNSNLRLSAAQVKGNLDAQLSFFKLGQELDQLKIQIGSGLAPQLSHLVDEFGGFIRDDGPQIVTFLQDAAHDTSVLATDVNSVVQAFGGWEKVAGDLIALKLASEISGITTSIAAFFGLAAPPWLWPLVAVITAMNAAKGALERHGVSSQAGPSPMKRSQSDLGPALGDLGQRLTGRAAPSGPIFPALPGQGAPAALPPGFHRESYHPGGGTGGGIVPASYSPGGATSVMRELQDAVAKGSEKGTYDGIFDVLRSSMAGDGSGGRAGNIIRGSYSPSGGSGGGLGGGAPSMGSGGSGTAPGAATPASRSVGGFGVPTGSAAPVSRNLGKNQQEAFSAARAQGLSDSAARLLVANMSGESLSNPANSHWDVSHISQGIVQWDPARAEAIRRKFGALPKDMSVADQTKAAIWEMKTKYPSAWGTLNNENLSNAQRLYGVVHGYERPADPMAATEQRMRFLRSLKVQDRSEGGLLGNAQKAGLLSGSQQPVKGDASLRIDLNGFPKGTRTNMQASGMFKQVALNRGYAPRADRES